MTQKPRVPRRAFAAIFVVVAAVAAGAFTAASSSAAAPTANPINVRPLISAPQTLLPGSLPTFSCQARPIDGSTGRPRCYEPNQIQKAYGYDGLLASGVNGAGETILIVDAYSNPYIPGDLAIQDAIFGLPAADYHVVAPAGAPPAFDITDPNQAGWAEEITLDVLWAHAMAPAAKLVLVEGKSSNDVDLYNAEKAAIDANMGDVVSQSFGEAESCVDPTVFDQWHQLFQEAADKGMTVFASTGDSGAAQFNCAGNGAILAASFPASDPNVTAVGGTTLSATNPDGSYVGETAWTEQLFGCNPPAVADADINCSGGGFSTIFGRPPWQEALVKGGKPHAGRGIPDVSYDAGVNGGVLTHCSVCNILVGLDPSALAFFIFGGTSAGSPQWSALAADADQMAGHRIGTINRLLYQIGQAQSKYSADLHDVVGGNNDVAEIGGQGYDSVSGWDPVTGLGTPNAANLLPALVKGS